jgi:hypothetical protein
MHATRSNKRYFLFFFLSFEFKSSGYSCKIDKPISNTQGHPFLIRNKRGATPSYSALLKKDIKKIPLFIPFYLLLGPS